jgi:hypothetical protein
VQIVESKRPENRLTHHEAHHIFSIISKIAGSHPDLSKWDWTKRGWAGTRLSDSVKRGCVVLAVWKTLTTSGWRTDRKLCLKEEE